MTSPKPVRRSAEVEDSTVAMSDMVKNLSVVRKSLRRCRVPRRYNQFSRSINVSKRFV